MDKLHKNIVISVVAKLMFPIIILFALYIQIYGEYSPGGGFQAGVLLATAFILYGVYHGVIKLQNILSTRYLRILASLGILIYAFVGLACILQDGEFLNYSYLATNASDGQKLGIFLVELGVGITVCSSMLLIYYKFSERLCN